jgi:adenosylcobinamide-phosphate synthase
MTRAPRVRRLAPAAAVAADAAFGEPPAWLHPTVAMGRLLAGARRRQAVAAGGAAHAFAWGVSTVAAGALAAWAAGRLVERAAGRARDPLGVALTGLALKPALSVRALLSAAGEVERALRASDLAGARRLLAWHLVSRDTVDLSPAEVAGAAVESVAENFNDAVVAPILAFRVGGLGLAYAHRFVNTADAMLGYRTPELEWFGKTAARADDVLGLAPARLSALLIALAAPAGGGSTAAALHVAARDAGRTASPNAGWPMAAMAGALGVRLTKRAAYTLNPRGREPGWRDLARSRRVVAAAAALAVGAAAA